MKTISIINFKGGVGKTTISLHLASMLAKKHKVLMVDLDPQLSLTEGFIREDDGNWELTYNINELLIGNTEVEIYNRNNEKNLYLLQGFGELNFENFKPTDLKTKLNLVGNAYDIDYIIIDCPPSVFQNQMKNSHPISSIIASDFLIIPIKADAYSMKGLMKFVKAVYQLKEKYKLNTQIAGVVFNFVVERRRNWKLYRNEFFNNPVLQKFMFKSYIRETALLESIANDSMTIFEVDPNSPSAYDFELFFKEFLKRIK